MNPCAVLILPGWQNSGPLHWQSRWEAAHGFQRVEQHDWLRPLRGDWTARLEEVLLGLDEPAVLVAHSLGCLLVAPGDVEREALRPVLPSWSPVPLQRLPFASVLVGSRNDPFCSAERARQFADAWGSRWVDAGERGHLNADSALGDWPEGLALLQTLRTSKSATKPAT